MSPVSLTVLESKLEIGAEKPFTVIHLSDIHLNYSDRRDPAEIQLLSKIRKRKYPGSLSALREAGSLADKTGFTIISTGDMCDFISEKNLEAVRAFTSSHNAFYTPGNHDFRIMGGMRYDVPEVRQKTFGRVQAVYPNSLSNCSFVMNGVKFVLLDDVYYRFEKQQLQFLKNEVAEGLPVVLAMHIPLYEESLYMKTSRDLTRHASLVCVPPEKMYFYKPERVIQQTEDTPTREMYDYILSEPRIKCLLTGHSHKNHEAVLPGGATQFTTGLHTVRTVEFT